MKNRRYLNRIIVTVISLVMIPAIILTVVFRIRASRAKEKSDQAYYAQLVDSFGGDFEERLSQLQQHALDITLEGKLDKSIFHQRAEEENTRPYWYYQAVLVMQDKYFHFNASDCGIYYYDVDRAITVRGATPKMYFLSALGVRDPEHKAWEFFDSQRHASGKWIFSSTYTEPEKNAYILAGYCTELGKNKDQVMIFYTLSRDDYAGLQSVIYQQSGINFYIKDADGNTLLFIGDSRMTDGTVYRAQSERLPLNFEILVSENSLDSNRDAYYRDTRTTLAVLAVVLVLFCVASIVFVYRPVFSITAELEKNGRQTDEFGSIRNALGERNAKIMEQENLILDLLLKHLIHGVPISQKAMNRLGVDKSMDHYCVFVIDGYVLPASEVEKLSGAMEADLSARLFCTDWNGENKSILILFQAGPDISSAKAMLSQWLQYNSPEDCLLRAGTTVDRLDGIRESFLSCLEQINGKEQDQRSIREELTTLENRDCQQKLLEKKILDYLEIHFRDEELSQVLVADVFGISTYSLSRLFKSRIGIGFAEYVNTKKLEYAKNLLLTTSLPIRQIALESGYASESYFSRVFKATYGVSPSAFKEQ